MPHTENRTFSPSSTFVTFVSARGLDILYDVSSLIQGLVPKSRKEMFLFPMSIANTAIARNGSPCSTSKYSIDQRVLAKKKKTNDGNRFLQSRGAHAATVATTAAKRRRRTDWSFHGVRASADDEKSEEDGRGQDMDESLIGRPINAKINPITAEPLVKGQITAIVTGAVSVAIAVLYLCLVQVMDSREMVPPVEEEAYGDGSVVQVAARVEKKKSKAMATNEKAFEQQFEMVEIE
jgi:hypothetical protein